MTENEIREVINSLGTYIIKLDPQGPAVGSATFMLYNVPADPSAAITIGGAAATLTTTTPGQNAGATFAGTLGQQATLRLTGNTMGSVTVKLLRPDGTQVATSTSSAASFNLSTVTLSVTGTYAITVDPASTNTGSINVGA